MEEQPKDYTQFDSDAEKANIEKFLGVTGQTEKLSYQVIRTINLKLDQSTVEKLGQIALEKGQSISDTILEAIQFFLIFF